jgi:hypothetical protein
MQVALMIPCYVDLFYPEVGVATLELLEKLKVDVVYPFDQTCCGQPMANSGCYEEAQATEELFYQKLFRVRSHRDSLRQLHPSSAAQFHRCARFAGTPKDLSQRLRPRGISARRPAGA